MGSLLGRSRAWIGPGFEPVTGDGGACADTEDEDPGLLVTAAAELEGLLIPAGSGPPALLAVTT